jgi:hypothetical protein
MSEKLAKLNRLRANAGKSELKSWKASQEKLDEAITKLESEGFTDVLPGANPDAPPVIEDPEVAKARPVEEPPADEPKTKDGNGPTKVKPGLGRGLHDEKYAAHSRKAIQDHRRAEKAAEKENKAKLSPEDKAQIKAEAKLRKGEVDPKKDPKKAARQKKHIEEKQAKRAAEGKTSKKKEIGKDQISVADLARKLDMDPKIARAKLRRYEDKKDYPKPVKGERWVFPKSAEKDLTKILK